jgi:hypothetical protein
LDGELGRHVESKTEAENEAAPIRAAILAGTFRRAVTTAPLPYPRGKPVANTLPKEPSSVGHEQAEQPSKDLLH